MYKLFILLLLNSSINAMHNSCKRAKQASQREQRDFLRASPRQLALQAIRNGDTKTLHALLEYIDLNLENSSGESFLTKAAKENQLTIVELLLATRKINLRTQGSVRALLWAAQQSNECMVRTLVNTGISVNGKDNLTGYTPLMMAVYKNSSSMVSLLLKHPALDLTIKNDEGHTAYSLAVRLNYKDIFHTIHAVQK